MSHERDIRICLTMAQAKALLFAADHSGKFGLVEAKKHWGKNYTGPSIVRLTGALRILAKTIANVEDAIAERNAREP